jgi:hypothetical protein
MTTPGQPGDRYSIKIGGNVGGQLAAGDNNTMIQNRSRTAGAASPQDLAELHALVQSLKGHIAAEAAPDKAASALERVDELEEAVTAEKPEVSTVGYVLAWFRKNLPSLAGSVVGLLVNPILGKVVEAAGEMAAGEFRRQVGAED